MYDAASRYEPAGLQRARGELKLALKRRGAATVPAGWHQAGCLKARLPRPAAEGWADIVTMNISGGVAGGDRLDSVFEIGAGARATIAAQAAERFYRTLDGGAPSEVRTRIVVAEGAAAEWLPQETILFDGCAMDRHLAVELADGASFVGVEALVFGRAAMGERLGQALVRDLIEIRRAGRLVLYEAVWMDGAVDRLLHRSAVADGARAAATIVHVAPDAEGAIDAVRDALLAAPGESGASAWNGMLIVRLLAAEAASLRQAVVGALRVLRGSRPLPRVWLC